MQANPLHTALALAVPVLLALSSCAPEEVDHGEPPLAGATIGGPFELIDKDSKTVRWSDFEGQYRIVYFGYAYCPDVCPTDVQRTIQGLNQFSEKEPELGAKITPIFVTIDPERDTPDVVGEFANAFSEDLIGLTGTPDQIAAAAKAFAVYYSKDTPSENGAYLMSHSDIAYLFGPSGEPLATLPKDLGADAVTQELAKWVR